MMNKVDRGVLSVVAVLLGCVCVKTALEAAVSLIIPVVLVAVAYGGFRAWQTGWLAKLMPKKAEEPKKEVS
jgi:hypothetical protein